MNAPWICPQCFTCCPDAFECCGSPARFMVHPEQKKVLDALEDFTLVELQLTREAADELRGRSVEADLWRALCQAEITWRSVKLLEGL